MSSWKKWEKGENAGCQHFLLCRKYFPKCFFFLTFIKICDYSANGYIGIMYYRDAPNPDFLRAKQPFSVDVKLEKYFQYGFLPKSKTNPII